jgi:hypothetical protein
MSKFKLIKQFSNQLVTKFHVLRGDDIVGSINIKPDEEADLLRHWSGPAPSASAQAGAGIPAMRMAAAMLRAKPARMSRAALLRS